MTDRLTSDRDPSAIITALRRRWWVFLLLGLLAGAGAYLLSDQRAKTYTASSALLLQNSQLDQKLFGNQVFNNQDPARQAATEQSLVSLPTVADLTAKQLHISSALVRTEVSVGSDANSDVLSVTATDSSAARAAAMANAYVEQYISFRQQADRSQLNQAEQLVTSQLASIPPQQQNSVAAQNLQQRSLELKLLASLQTGNAEVVQTASPPTTPAGPHPTRDGVIGLILGLLAAAALVTVLERSDRRLKLPSEVEALYGLPIIGTVPESANLRTAGGIGTPREQDAFRMIRATLRYVDVDRDIRTVMITSAESGEGKSLIALNLARATARTDDKRTLLIEADMRKPSLAPLLGVSDTRGLAELLTNPDHVAVALHGLTVTPRTPDGDEYEKFDVLLAGKTPPNPVELLQSQRMVELIQRAAATYDIVIIDTPPISVVSDPISLVHQVDGVLIVSRLGRSRRDQSIRLMKQLRGLNARVLGVVVNGMQPTAGEYYGYYSGSNGSEQDPSRRRLAGRSRQTTKN